MQNCKNSSRGIQKTASNLSQIMEDILQRAKCLGASDAMVNVDSDEGYSVDVRMGEVENISFNEDKGVNLVVYFGHRKGQASTTDTRDEALQAMVVAACDIAQVGAEDPCFGLADRELACCDFPDLDLNHPWDIKPPQAIELALSCEQHALSQDPRITHSDGVNLSTYQFIHGFANTYGGLGTLLGSRHSISCSLIAKVGEEMKRDYDYTTSRNASDLLGIQALAQSAAKHTVERLGARKIKTQKVPVLFSSRVSGGILSSFVNAISGANLYRKNTFLLDSLGQAIFPQQFRIYEQPHLLQALGSAPFDSEGVLTRNNVFIENGYLTQYILGSYSARRLGLATTANSGGVHNLTLEAKTQDLQQIIGSMEKGLFVTELMGQGVNILTGDYSRGAAGFWIEQGEIKFPVEGITIAGNLRNMFRDIKAVGNDINPNIAMRCGSLLIDGLTVAGY